MDDAQCRALSKADYEQLLAKLNVWALQVMMGTKPHIDQFVAQSLEMLRHVCTVFNSNRGEITGI